MLSPTNNSAPEVVACHKYRRIGVMKIFVPEMSSFKKNTIQDGVFQSRPDPQHLCPKKSFKRFARN